MRCQVKKSDPRHVRLQNNPPPGYPQGGGQGYNQGYNPQGGQGYPSQGQGYGQGFNQGGQGFGQGGQGYDPGMQGGMASGGMAPPPGYSGELDDLLQSC